MTLQTEETSHDGTNERPLRRDAERNRQRVLAAAADVFRERGLDATLDEVARAAGVGVGTVYRRFPDKETLIAELFKDRIDNLVVVAQEALAMPDPWESLTRFLYYGGATMADDLGLRQLFMFGTYSGDQVRYASDRMHPVVTRLVERAQASGDLRADLHATDVKMIAFMLASVAEYAATAPDLWRRYLTLILDGLRPSRDGASALPAAAPTQAELEEFMHAGQRPAARRRP
jgi:AcrR family transcriptional regulator